MSITPEQQKRIDALPGWYSREQRIAALLERAKVLRNELQRVEQDLIDLIRRKPEGQ